MCKVTKYKTCNTRIDKCIKQFIENLTIALKDDTKILACCCGHGKYAMTIIVKKKYKHMPSENYDLVSGVFIPRKKKFYKRDKQGYYYVPETVIRKSITKYN